MICLPSTEIQICRAMLSLPFFLHCSQRDRPPVSDFTALSIKDFNIHYSCKFCANLISVFTSQESSLQDFIVILTIYRIAGAEKHKNKYNKQCYIKCMQEKNN